MSSQPIILKRDCEAVMIPSGYKVTLTAGSEVVITQSLGGSYTVTTDDGYMVRIAGKDADALGLTAESPATDSTDSTAAPADLEQAVWEQLKTCYDPEIPVNIVELGLVYHCKATALPTGGNRVDVKFTLTAPGCGMADVLKMEIESKVQAIPGVKECEVEVVFEPPWSRDMMSEAAKLDLGLL